MLTAFEKVAVESQGSGRGRQSGQLTRWGTYARGEKKTARASLGENYMLVGLACRGSVI